MPRDFMPSAVTAVVIPLDLLDTGPSIVIQANLPGVKPEEINLTVTGNTLTIKGAVQERNDFQGATYLRRERRTVDEQQDDDDSGRVDPLALQR